MTSHVGVNRASAIFEASRPTWPLWWVFVQPPYWIPNFLKDDVTVHVQRKIQGRNKLYSFHGYRWRSQYHAEVSHVTHLNSVRQMLQAMNELKQKPNKVWEEVRYTKVAKEKKQLPAINCARCDSWGKISDPFFCSLGFAIHTCWTSAMGEEFSFKLFKKFFISLSCVAMTFKYSSGVELQQLSELIMQIKTLLKICIK